MNRHLLTALALTLGVVMGNATHANLYLDAGPFSSLLGWQNGDYTAGSEFTVSLPGGILVNELGYLDAEGDGLEVDHRVGLWRVSDQALLASVIVTPGSATRASSHATGVWYMESIGTTLNLAPGTYRIGGVIGDGDRFALINNKIGNGVTISSGYVRSDTQAGFAYPNLNFNTNGLRVTAGFSQPVPEPGAVALLGGLGIVALVRPRR